MEVSEMRIFGGCGRQKWKTIALLIHILPSGMVESFSSSHHQLDSTLLYERYVEMSNIVGFMCVVLMYEIEKGLNRWNVSHSCGIKYGKLCINYPFLRATSVFVAPGQRVMLCKWKGAQKAKTKGLSRKLRRESQKGINNFTAITIHYNYYLTIRHLGCGARERERNFSNFPSGGRMKQNIH